MVLLILISRGFKGYDVVEGTKAVKNISKYLAKHGTTSFTPTAMTNNWKVILKSLREIANNEVWVSKNLGIHIEGPFIGLSKKRRSQTWIFTKI
ncbi:hypothetical protein NW739_01845 [Mycoplasmopsis felis]|uniref:hypothetical protein n=1 Tax=Mycoplasmopsis felis TaxID=33923 RepID=UPI0021DFDF46|nr:hypothetical protein [Mycoplasmopsis felis]MCU9939539.1 hypothetical protein [Mycoplasmopsis felis]